MLLYVHVCQYRINISELFAQYAAVFEKLIHREFDKHRVKTIEFNTDIPSETKKAMDLVITDDGPSETGKLKRPRKIQQDGERRRELDRERQSGIKVI